ncbi:hypothetical protein [Pseudochrobactrum saccharolyticum]|uniref:hypothetical protein n=1 Tax=Pseudochrobactrum saccharolyticum TaxID=354352 RepID=UPI0027455E37|nr:hypothetical protein [Pseudochrobactrum saccharolyticum]MDP8249625.1 hypothetical protein [Pseudochrobactrum saccharolyticum]
MALTYPLDILTGFPGWSTEFDLLYRQEYSRTEGGVTIAKDRGTPLWKAAFQSIILQPNELDIWRARLKAMDGSLQQFSGRPMSRCFPIAFPNGMGIGDVSGVRIETIGTNNKSLTLLGLPVWFSITIGDYLQIGTKLYQVLESAVANASGKTTNFELRPHLAPGTAVGNVVTLIKPSVPMIILPGSLTTSAELSTGRGTISFQAIESR